MFEQRFPLRRLIRQNALRFVQLGPIRVGRLAVLDHAAEVDVDDERRVAARAGDFDFAFELAIKRQSADRY